MSQPLISICIPTWEMFGKAEYFLRHSLTRIHLQTYQNTETVITDHSRNNKIEKLCKEFSTFMRISYHRIETKRGSPSHNTNQSILKSSGSLCKLLCMDDFLYNQYAVQKIVDVFENPDVAWCASSYVHTENCETYFNRHIPSVNDNIHLINTIGSPSCITISRDCFISFDESLTFYYDSDFYKRMITNFGNPYILDETTMVNYLHPHQITNTIANEELRNRELVYVKEKFA